VDPGAVTKAADNPLFLGAVRRRAEREVDEPAGVLHNPQPATNIQPGRPPTCPRVYRAQITVHRSSEHFEGKRLLLAFFFPTFSFLVV